MRKVGAGRKKGEYGNSVVANVLFYVGNERFSNTVTGYDGCSILLYYYIIFCISAERVYFCNKG